MSCALVYAEVTEVQPGWARVKFPQYDDIVSDWLPVGKPRAMNDDFNWPLEVGEQVVCLMNATNDDMGDTGVILCAINNDVDRPDSDAGAKKFRMKFSDGGALEYDKTAKKWMMKSGGGESIYELLRDILKTCEDITVNTAMGPSSTPLNVSAPGASGFTFTQLLTRLDKLFK